MRNLRRLCLLLVAATFSSFVHAQVPRTSIRISDLLQPGAQVTQRMTGPAQIANNQQNQRLSPGLTTGRPHGTQMTATCGPDTLEYPLAKATGFQALGISDSLAVAQWYDAPQPITVRGMSFYAWVDSATNQTVTLVCQLFNAGLDSLPTGAALATATIVIDSNFYGGNLTLLEKSVNFSAPVTVNGPYCVTVRNNSAIAVGFVANDYTAGDGLQEWLGHIYLPAPNSAWFHGYQLTLGPFPFDADNIIMPHVTYQLTSAFTPTVTNSCVGTPVNFTNTSSPVAFSRFYNVATAAGVQDTTFNWTYGTGGPSQYIVNGSNTYAAPGTFTVTLRDTLYGWRMGVCTDQSTGTVNISAAGSVVANFSTTSAGNTANFTNTSTGGPTTYAWTFGDGGTSTLQNPSHTYGTPGVYNVCLTATGPCGTNTSCQQVSVGCPPLIASFQDTIQGLQYGVLSTSTGTPTTYLWDFGDGSTATTSNAIHVYAQAGVYNVCLTISDGCSTDSTCTTVVIGCPIPISNFSFLTTGQTTAFSDLSTNLPATWFWSFGDGNTSTTPSPTHTYATVGTFTACLIVSSTCGADTLCQTVTTGCNTPVAAFTNTASGLTSIFTDLSTNTPTGWLWDFGDGNTSTLPNPNHTYTAAGTYNVCLTVTSNCGSNTTCNNITVSCPAPAASYTSTNSGLTASFTNTSTGSPTTYSWTFGDGGTSTLQNPTHAYASGGSYQVCLTVTSPCGSNTTCQTVVVNCPTPNSNFSFSSVNLNFNFTSLATGNPSSITWLFGDGGTSTSNNPTHTYANSGVYNVCLVATNGCGADTFCIPVTASCPTPNANFNFSSNNLVVNFSDLTTGNPTGWSWNFGDGSPASIQSSPSHSYAAPGTYQVCLTAQNACGTDSSCTTLVVSCPAPSANFSFLTIGNTINFSNTAVGATSYAWSFGDGGTSTVASPSHTYTSTGTFNVCLVTSSVCGQDTFCQNVIITCVPPVSSFNYAVSQDSIVSFTNLASPNSTSWTWTFGDGTTTTAANPTHTYAAPGTYTVCLEVVNTCGRDTICQDITITCVNPTSGFLVSMTNAVAQFTTVSLLAQSYSWNFGDGTSSNLPSPQHAYTTSGIFTACLTVTNFCGSNTSCQNIVVSCNPPVAAFNAINGVSSVGFIDQSNNFPTEWLWNFGDGATDTVQNPNHVFLFPGQYFVCLTAINSCGTNTTCNFVTVTAVGEEEQNNLEASMTVYPNPSTGEFTVQGELAKAEALTFSVYNALGQEVFRAQHGKTVGSFTQTIDLTDLASGMYRLEVRAGSTVANRTLLKAQ